jgi:hypothetical protein
MSEQPVIGSNASSGGGGSGASIGTATPLMDGVASAGSSTAAAADDHVHPTDTSLAPKASPTFTGTPAAPTASATTSTTQIATTAMVQAAILAGVEHAAILTIGGVISPTMTDAADFYFVVPFNATLKRMKATVKAPVTGSCAVKLRSAAAAITTPPTFGDVTGFTCTFSSGNVLATVSPSTVNVGEGDFLGLSVTTGSGVNLLVEVVLVAR